MGCSTCKSKSKNRVKTKDVKFETVDSNTEEREERVDNKILNGLSEIAPQSIGIKFITFTALIVAIPLFAVYLLGYIFTLFFFTKNQEGKGISFTGIINTIFYPFNKWKQFRGRIRERAREREFAKTVGYDDMSEVSVVVDEKLKEKREYTGEEELEGVELLVTDKVDNNNG